MLAAMLNALIAFFPLAPMLVGAVTHTDPVPENAELRTLADGLGFLEGPVWVPSENALVFSDIPGKKLMRWSEADGVSELTTAKHPNGAVLDVDGTILSCEHGSRSIVRRSPDTGELLEVVVERPEGQRFNSPNDLVLQSSGAIWFTDPPWGLVDQTKGRELRWNHVFRWDPVSRIAKPVFSHLSMPNGIALSPMESILYVSDTGGHRSHPHEPLRAGPATVTAYGLEGRALEPEPLWQRETRSDGMCVDARGRLYLTGSPGVTIWGPDGRRIGEIEVPGSTTNVCFGGAGGSTLFVTAGKALFAMDLAAAAKH